MPRPATLVVAVLAAAALGSAQDKKGTPTDAGGQKRAAIDNLTKAGFGTPGVIETDNFVVATTLPAEKAKALGAVLEKVAPVARKAAQFEDADEPWKGKLTVYFLPDGREFRAFMRGVLVVKPEGVHYDLRAAEPFVVDPVELPGKPAEADQFWNTAAVVGGAYLKAKGGAADLPDWLRDGFGKATALRAEGTTSKRYQAFRTAVRGATARGGKVADLWGETRPPAADVLAAGFAEYLAFGPGAANFPKFVSGFRPGENGEAPTVPQALEAAGWKDWSALDAAWRRWLATGK
jgi:hypothetical protein